MWNSYTFLYVPYTFRIRSPPQLKDFVDQLYVPTRSVQPSRNYVKIVIHLTFRSPSEAPGSLSRLCYTFLYVPYTFLYVPDGFAVFLILETSAHTLEVLYLVLHTTRLPWLYCKQAGQSSFVCHSGCQSQSLPQLSYTVSTIPSHYHLNHSHHVLSLYVPIRSVQPSHKSVQ